MSLCPNCASWCATTEKQLAVRLRNIAAAPEIEPLACPTCDGTEWAATDKFVVKGKSKKWWEFLRL